MLNEDRLHTTTLGEEGSLVVFCHGLFGQGRNWNQIGKALVDRHRVLLVDMPEHGRSPWTDRLDYVRMADRVAELLDPADPVALVGHSMGGKAAMVLALRHPDLVDRLCVVDVAPVDYQSDGEERQSEFAGYIDAMQALDLGALERRSDADEALQEAVPHPTVRGFLLQNLRREGDGWRWQANLDLLERSLRTLSGWPEDELGEASYQGPVLWLGGERSDYVTDEHVAAMDRRFPRNRRVTVKGAGHWVHSEKPDVFVQVLRHFVDD